MNANLSTRILNLADLRNLGCDKALGRAIGPSTGTSICQSLLVITSSSSTPYGINEPKGHNRQPSWVDWTDVFDPRDRPGVDPGQEKGRETTSGKVYSR